MRLRFVEQEETILLVQQVDERQPRNKRKLAVAQAFGEQRTRGDIVSICRGILQDEVDVTQSAGVAGR